VLHTFTASLAGARKRVFAIGVPQHLRELNHARREIPELRRLEALIAHPRFPWMGTWGEVATGIEEAHWRNYGIVHGKNGSRIGRCRAAPRVAPLQRRGVGRKVVVGVVEEALGEVAQGVVDLPLERVAHPARVAG
jgi:hypothetical protein